MVHRANCFSATEPRAEHHHNLQRAPIRISPITETKTIRTIAETVTTLKTLRRRCSIRHLPSPLLRLRHQRRRVERLRRQTRLNAQLRRCQCRTRRNRRVDLSQGVG
jgi:hypothetical protein